MVTNVTPNHLDVHGTMEEYIAGQEKHFPAPGGLYRYGAERGLPHDCRLCSGGTGRLPVVQPAAPVERGAWLDEAGTLHYTDGKGDTPLFAMSEIKIPGLHNVENMLTAIAAVWGLVPPEVIRPGGEYLPPGVEHRH